MCNDPPQLVFGMTLLAEHRKSISEHQISKDIFWGSMPPGPPCCLHPQCSPDSLVIKKDPDFTYAKGWTVYRAQGHSSGQAIFVYVI